MNERDKKADEREDVVGQSIPVNDKRRFNDKGERLVTEDEEEKPKEPVKSPREVELETKLAAEMDRRLAAEAKLVGVQAKFEEAKSGLERETAEMRARQEHLLAQEIGEVLSRLDARLDRCAVDDQRDRLHCERTCASARRSATT